MTSTARMRHLALALVALLTGATMALPLGALAQVEEPAAEEAPAPADDDTENDDWDDETWDDETWDDETWDDEDLDALGLDGDETGASIVLDPVPVWGSSEEVERVGGSATIIGEEALEAFEYDDAHSVLTQAPGVYVRQEDAFGLRPNIGLRGANSDRSKKVTLMEGDVLLAPAPYAAPAAYYFPLMTRLVAVEVYKGPSAIAFGPNTIGGAIRLVPRGVPFEREGMLDASLGMFLTGKVHGYYGDRNDWGGFLLEGVYLTSDGFKTIDGGGDTGFDKLELRLVGVLSSDASADVFHELQLSLGYSQELSYETYLGLSDADFAADPYRRYAASAQGEMDWWRTSLELRYLLEAGDDFDLTTTLYRNDLDRSWRKLNAFRGGVPIEEVLADPTTGRRRILYDVLTGAEDSASDAEVLLIGTNHRTYVSQGVQTEAHVRAEVPDTLSVEVEVGARLHYDEIVRDHTEEGFDMRAGELVRDATPVDQTTANTGSALAFAAHTLVQVDVARFTVVPGLRLEWIQTELEDHPTGTTIENSDLVLIPGIGVHYAITDELGVLAGVHRGFSPVSPGQPDDVEPELSVNYEAGARYQGADGGPQAELIGFFNDYSNLTGECSFSAGCAEDQLDQQFNAGRVHVWGLEAMAAYTVDLESDLYLPLRAAYTLTQSSFQTGFESENPQLGDVEEGDELPYVPEHQASVQIGVGEQGQGLRRWSVNLSATYVAAMREEAGTGDEGPLTDEQINLDATASWEPIDGLSFYARGDNLTGAAPIVARRPFGARPGRPLMVQGGVRYDF
jgi:Fe(3+) dicitrate transport protein